MFLKGKEDKYVKEIAELKDENAEVKEKKK